MTADIRELMAYAHQLEHAVPNAEPELSKVVERGAYNIKRGAQTRLRSWSRLAYLKHYYRSISYDMLNPLEAEVGPDPTHLQGRMGRGVEFGSAHAAPAPHMLPSADDEEPKFVDQATPGVVPEPDVTLPDVVLAMIRAAVPDVDVFDGIVPETPPSRYVIVYIDDGTLRALAACGVSDSATVRWQTTSVAPDRQMASWIATTIRDATVDRTPVADGWGCGQIQHVFSERPGRDETVQERPVVFKPDLYDLLATRA